MPIAIPQDTVYILACEGGRYYIGYTRHLHFRLVQHFGAHGAKFTQKYRPLSLLAWMPGDEKREFVIWQTFVKIFGLQNVGGFHYYPRTF